MTELRWHIAQTRAGAERVAQEAIADLPFETYLPLAWTKYDPPKPMFRGYLFVRFDRDVPGWPEIYQVKGVIGLLGRDEWLAWVTPQQIERVRKAEAAMEADSTNACPYGPEPWPPGTPVEVNLGPHTTVPATYNGKTGRKEAEVEYVMLGIAKITTVSLSRIRAFDPLQAA